MLLENCQFSPSSAEFNRSLATLCRMFPSINDEQLKVILIKSSGSLEQAISALLILNAKREHQSHNPCSENRSGLNSKESDNVWYEDPDLRHRSLQQRKSEALERARAVYLEKNI